MQSLSPGTAESGVLSVCLCLIGQSKVSAHYCQEICPIDWVIAEWRATFSFNSHKSCSGESFKCLGILPNIMTPINIGIKLYVPHMETYTKIGLREERERELFWSCMPLERGHTVIDEKMVIWKTWKPVEGKEKRTRHESKVKLEKVQRGSVI